MYIAGFVIPVPTDQRAAYQQWASNSAELFKELGCLEVVDAWGDDLPTGNQTDFFRAVHAREGENVVLNWQVWPDKSTLEAAEQRMQQDPRFDIPAQMPFDPKRLIFGGFHPIQMMGRRVKDGK